MSTLPLLLDHLVNVVLAYLYIYNVLTNPRYLSTTGSLYLKESNPCHFTHHAASLSPTLETIPQAPPIQGSVRRAAASATKVCSNFALLAVGRPEVCQTNAMSPPRRRGIWDQICDRSRILPSRICIGGARKIIAKGPGNLVGKNISLNNQA